MVTANAWADGARTDNKADGLDGDALIEGQEPVMKLNDGAELGSLAVQPTDPGVPIPLCVSHR